ncbi:winged helix-turn-helix transcriptional regulator [Candidatus Woesearchaeota archaeon]|nr:winged helix-turn-helix transcriptional regulator [Candidatus Woesearchaeota archaeon]
MNLKKIGIVVLALGFVVGFILVNIFSQLDSKSEKMGCFQEPGCKSIEKNLNITHFAFGVVGFIIALGAYLLFFYKGEEEILKRLEENKSKLESDEKFKILLMGLDESTKEVIKFIKDDEGISQSSLFLKVKMSKAKLSQILQDLEKKGLIKRIDKKKTKLIYFSGKW